MTLNKTKIIGLTGGIATGKSTVTKYLLEKGFIVIDADIVAREVVEVNKPAYNDIVKEFGEDVLNQDLTINRVKLGSIIFNNKDSRMKLNSIVHPRVTDEMLEKINELSFYNNILFVDIPLLIENRENLENNGLKFDSIWLVYTTEEQQLERLMKRDNINKESAYSRITAQISIDKKIKNADVIIYNTRNESDLIEELDCLIDSLEK